MLSNELEYCLNDAFQRALEPYIRTEAPSAAPESDAPAAEINLSEATQALLDETPVEGKRSERIMAAAGALRRYGPRAVRCDLVGKQCRQDEVCRQAQGARAGKRTKTLMG